MIVAVVVYITLPLGSAIFNQGIENMAFEDWVDGLEEGGLRIGKVFNLIWEIMQFIIELMLRIATTIGSYIPLT